MINLNENQTKQLAQTIMVNYAIDINNETDLEVVKNTIVSMNTEELLNEKVLFYKVIINLFENNLEYLDNYITKKCTIPDGENPSEFVLNNLRGSLSRLQAII